VSGACGTNGEEGERVWLLVGKPEGKKPLGRPRRRWMYNINMDFEEIGLGGVDLWNRIMGMRQQIAYSQNATKPVQNTADDHKCAPVCD
jgi:hypothetical protein